MESERSRITLLLNRLGDGDRETEQEILERTYAELQRLASAQMRGRASGHTLQPTALVHEAWMRLVDQDELRFEGRAQFYGLASRVMRSVLVDHHRAKKREKRGGNLERVSLTLHDESESNVERAIDVLALEDALARLEAFDLDLCRIVEMRFFGGLSHPEIASAMDVPLRTIERRWRRARAWLSSELDRD